MSKYARVLCLLFAGVLLVHELVFPIQAAALIDPIRLQRQDAWGIDNECRDSSSVGSFVLAGNNNVEKILNFYMRKGLNLAQAAGIVGNIMQESGLQPNIVQGGRLIGEDEEYTMQNGVGFGLVQWTFTSRQAPLQQHVDSLGVKNTDLGGQLSYTWLELESGYLSTLNQLRATNNPVEAAIVFHDGYEKSADSPGEVRSVRGGNAQKIYDEYKDAPALAGSEADDSLNNPSGEESVDEHGRAEKTANSDTSQKKASANCESSGFDGGNLPETTAAYAWPQYISPGNSTESMPGQQGKTIRATDPTDAYDAAIKDALGKGLYVGGTALKGIDCGGFVTLLVRNSGYDPGYNYDGRGGNTTSQEAWMKENWEHIGTSSGIDAGKLQPGDVAINSTHTFIFVGSEVEGFNGVEIASASWDERAPMADDKQSPVQPGYNWYRKK